MPTEKKNFDIIIVGLGPVGAVMANLLGKFNFSGLVLEQKKRNTPVSEGYPFRW